MCESSEMAEAGISVDQFSVDHFSCPVCLDLLKDPVTTPCGHNFCKVCINERWNQEDQRGIYSCRHCRETISPKLVLCRNTMLAEVVEQLKKTKTERTEKESELKEEQRKSQQRIQEKQKKLQELKQAVNNIKSRAQAAVQDNERMFTDLISFMMKKLSEVTELIQDLEKAELNQAERLLQQLEQETADLKRRVGELEQLSHTVNHIHFLQSLPSLFVASRCEDSPSITVNQNISFDGVTKYICDLKEHLVEFCKNEFNKISVHDFCQLTLDPNTAHPNLILSKNNKVMTYSDKAQPYSDHPERFDSYRQVLCKESVSGCCYWEVEFSDDVFISASYKEISRKGEGKECEFGSNIQSWSLWCSSSSVCFYHNNIKTAVKGPSSSRIGVYVDHSAGTLSFYSISDTMRLLERVQTTFTQPLYAGFGVLCGTVRLCDPK